MNHFLKTLSIVAVASTSVVFAADTAAESVRYKHNKNAPDASKVVVHKPLSFPSELTLVAPEKAEKVTKEKAENDAVEAKSFAVVPANVLDGKTPVAPQQAASQAAAFSILTGSNSNTLKAPAETGNAAKDAQAILLGSATVTNSTAGSSTSGNASAENVLVRNAKAHASKSSGQQEHTPLLNRLFQ